MVSMFHDLPRWRRMGDREITRYDRQRNVCAGPLKRLTPPLGNFLTGSPLPNCPTYKKPQDQLCGMRMETGPKGLLRFSSGRGAFSIRFRSQSSWSRTYRWWTIPLDSTETCSRRWKAGADAISEIIDRADADPHALCSSQPAEALVGMPC